MPGLADTIRDIPPVIRFFTICSVAVCFAHGLAIIDLRTLLCFPGDIVNGWNVVTYVYRNGGDKWDISRFFAIFLLQSYKFFTAFIVPHGLGTAPGGAIMDIYFFYTFAKQLEDFNGKFRRNFPDCLWFTLITGTILILLTFVFYFVIGHGYYANPSHHQMMLSCVTYLWLRELKNAQVNFLGIIPIKAYYLPLFNLSLKLFGGIWSCVDTIIGIFGGYLYQCMQSRTMPFYNLLPGAYPSPRLLSGTRVGTVQSLFRSNNSNLNAQGTTDDMIYSSIFDRGYLKAPIWLYNLLEYPINNLRRTTAFAASPHSQKTTVEVKGTSSAFRGSGQRLGN